MECHSYLLDGNVDIMVLLHHVNISCYNQQVVIRVVAVNLCNYEHYWSKVKKDANKESLIK